MRKPGSAKRAPSPSGKYLPATARPRSQQKPPAAPLGPGLHRPRHRRRLALAVPCPREFSPLRLGRRRQAEIQCFNPPHPQFGHFSDQVHLATFTRRLYLNPIRAFRLAAGPQTSWWAGPAFATPPLASARSAQRLYLGSKQRRCASSASSGQGHGGQVESQGTLFQWLLSLSYRVSRT